MFEVNDKETLLERYLNGTATETERAWVAQKLATDAVWQSCYHSMRLPEAALNYHSAVTKSRRPQTTIMQQAIEDSRRKVAPIKRLLRVSVAVSAALLLLFAGYKAYQLYQLSTDKIYAESYVPYNVTLSTADDYHYLNPFAESYQNKNYRQVIALSKKARSLNDEERFLIGMSFFELGDYFSSITWLSHAANNLKNPYCKDAAFYLALAFLKNKDFDNCISQMQVVMNNPENKYHLKFTGKMVQQVKWLKWK